MSASSNPPLPLCHFVSEPGYHPIVGILWNGILPFGIVHVVLLGNLQASDVLFLRDERQILIDRAVESDEGVRSPSDFDLIWQ